MIAQRSIEKVFETAIIEDVINEFVSLKRRGANLLGLCPFHNEKTPSFTVSPSKGLFKCFGCGRAGNAVGFIMEHEKLTYPEAIRWMAEKYRIEIEETNSGRTDEEQSIVNSLLIVSNFAKEYFVDQLWESEEGKKIGLTYFKERGFLESTIKKFDLGFTSRSWDGLLSAAKEKQFNINYLEQIGLIRAKEERKYDFFRDRVMFTIHNVTGKAIAFAGRTLTSDKKTPKYINSPESEIYIKNKILYGIFQAKDEIRKSDECLLVEGYTDVISMHQAGIENIVASSGTSLTENQVRLIKRYTKNITILYDGDEAGIKAATRGIEIILEQDMNVKILMLPQGEDPDSFIRKNGKSEFDKYAKVNKKDFILFKIDLLKESIDQNDPVQKANMIKEIVEVLAKIADPIKRSLYVQNASQLLHISEQILIFETNKIKKNEYRKKTNKARFEAEQIAEQANIEYEAPKQGRQFSDRTEFLERDLVRILLEFGDKNYDLETTVKDHVFSYLLDLPIKNKIYAQIIEQFKNANSSLNSEFFVNHIDPEISKTTADLLAQQHLLSKNWESKFHIIINEPVKNFKNDIDNLIDVLSLNFIEFNHKQILLKIQDMNKNKDSKIDEVQLKKYLLLINKINEKKEELAKKLGNVINKTYSN